MSILFYSMKQTTIQIHKEAKGELDKLKEYSRETYEDVIMKLIKMFKSQKVKQMTKMAEGYEEMAGDSKKIVKEWAVTEKELD